MKLKFLVIFLLLFNQLSYADTTFTSKEEFSNWFTYYYLKPKPEKMTAAIKFMSENGAIDKKSAFPGIFGFFSGVIRNNPDKSKIWVKELSSIKPSHYGIIILGIWYAKLPNSKEIIYEILSANKKLNDQYSYLKTGNPLEIKDTPLEQGPWVLDALWGQFMATGSSKPVERIIETLSWIDIKGNVGKLMIGGAANWSLRSNAVQHKRVFEIVNNLIHAQPKNSYLLKVKKDVEKELANRDKK